MSATAIKPAINHFLDSFNLSPFPNNLGLILPFWLWYWITTIQRYDHQSYQHWSFFQSLANISPQKIFHFLPNCSTTGQTCFISTAFSMLSYHDHQFISQVWKQLCKTFNTKSYFQFPSTIQWSNWTHEPRTRIHLTLLHRHKSLWLGWWCS